MDTAKGVAKNLKFILASELILAGLKFVSRRVFVIALGKEHLGLNGLFTDILSMLSLAELGFGVSVTYSLYRPAAQGDTQLIKSLVRLYRRVYQAVGGAVLAVGLALTPFLGVFVKEMPEGIPNIPLLYALSVVNAGVSYFWSYKSTLLFVYQRKYIDAAVRAAVALAAAGAQAAALLLTHNYAYTWASPSPPPWCRTPWCRPGRTGCTPSCGSGMSGLFRRRCWGRSAGTWGLWSSTG